MRLEIGGGEGWRVRKVSLGGAEGVGMYRRRASQTAVLLAVLVFSFLYQALYQLYGEYD